MLRRLLQVSIAILTFLAYANVAAATTITSYQPELPEELM
ncbi:cyclic lactone autoinducer peptide [Geosporobacter ferrireducens]|nr:cyclic lactone autoinducer peptide [Geosporobacter ferrireducens]MTI54093.1 cyclic lactone autoinducer peptide [Geosporobacter ferrireducens]